MSCVVLLQQLTNFKHVARFTNEGSGNKIDALLDPELNVVSVFLSDAWQGNVYAGYVHAFFALDRSAIDDAAFDFRSLNVNDCQTNQTVVDQNRRTDFHISRKIFVCDGNPVLIAENFFGRQGNEFILYQLDRLFFQFTGTDFRTFGVQQYGDRFPQLRTRLTNILDPVPMLFVITVGEVQASDVHSGHDQLLDVF
ncbi:hypothetical protein PAPH110629_14685 [Paenibacillus phoenicis]